MKTERWLQINTAALTVMSAMLYGMGQHDSLLPMVVIAAAVAAFFLTDVTGWLRLNRTVASIIAVAAFALVATHVFSRDPARSIEAIAQMLVYLQLILLFQRKDRRTYWQLIVLSLLLIVVSTIFRQGAFFGVVMVAYLFTTISAMALIFLHHESLRFAEVERPATRSDSASQRPWKFGDQKSYFAGDGIEKSGGQGIPARNFLGWLFRLGIGTLVFTAVAFFAMPRFGDEAWRSPFLEPVRMVGYSGKVELGELGSVTEDTSEVCRIEFTDVSTKRMYEVTGAVYLHGTILVDYDDNRWTRPRWGGRSRNMRIRLNAPRGDNVVQRVTMEPADRKEVFCVQPYYTLEQNNELRYHTYLRSLYRPEETCNDRYVFELRTNAFDKGRQKSLVPAPRMPLSMSRLLRAPAEKLPTLVELAERWMIEPGYDEDRIIDRARYLSSKLKNSDRFQYQLGSERQDHSIDAVEDFVKNNPNGHCEYFATTLTLMLRSQGIPARMVVGYCTDEFNPLGQYFQVRQLHAHTWVEVYLRPDQVPKETIHRTKPEEDWSRGAWLRLDPTPGSSSDEMGTTASVMSKAGKGISWLAYVWNTYVMEMDKLRQKQAVYRPLVDWLKGTYDRMTSLAWWKETGRRILHFLNPRNWRLGQWLSWRGLLTILGVIVGGWIVYRVIRTVVRRVRRWIAAYRSRTARAARIHVGFYERFRTLMATAGMRRDPGQTQREFARIIEKRLALEPEIDTLAGVPEQITDAFYRVRFGQHPLDNNDRQTVEQALTRLEEGIEGRKFTPGRAEDTITP